MDKLRKRNRELEIELETTKSELEFFKKHAKILHDQLVHAEARREQADKESRKQAAINDGLRQTIVESILQDCSSDEGSEELSSSSAM